MTGIHRPSLPTWNLEFRYESVIVSIDRREQSTYGPGRHDRWATTSCNRGGTSPGCPDTHPSHPNTRQWSTGARISTLRYRDYVHTVREIVAMNKREEDNDHGVKGRFRNLSATPITIGDCDKHRFKPFTLGPTNTSRS